MSFRISAGARVSAFSSKGNRRSIRPIASHSVGYFGASGRLLVLQLIGYCLSECRGLLTMGMKDFAGPERQYQPFRCSGCVLLIVIVKLSDKGGLN